MNNTLKLVDTGTAAWTLPAANTTGINTVSLSNNNTGTSAGVTEAATVTAVAMSAGQTLTVAGQTLLATTALSASAVAAALAGTATSGTGFTLAGSLSGWGKAAGGAGTNTIVYTSGTPNAPVADLTIGGTAQTGASQVTLFDLTTAAADGGTIFWNVTYNGVTTRTATLAADASATVQAAAIANTINAYAGRSIATANAGQVSVVSSSTVSLAFAAAATDGTLGTAAVFTYGLAPKSQTVTISTNATATTGTFQFNGVTQTTGTAGGATVTGAAAAFVAKINEVAGATIASNADGVITINYGDQGAVINNFAYTGSTFAVTNVVASSGTIVASPSSVAVSTPGALPSSGVDTINAALFASATLIQSDNSAGAVTVNGLVSTQAVGLVGNGSTNQGNLEANFATAATSATANISGGTRGATLTVTGTGLTSATINSTGAANTLGGTAIGNGTTGTAVSALTINAATSLITGGVTSQGGVLRTITTSGAATNGTTGNRVAVDLGTLANGVTTVDASGLTAGGIFTKLIAGVTSLRGGQGNDVIETIGGGATLTSAAASIAAGAGTDTLVIAAGGDIATINEGAKYTGFETLRLGDFSQDVSFVSGITALQLNASTSRTFSQITATQANNITVRDNQTTAVTLTLADATGTSDVVGLTLASTTSTTNVSVNGLSIIGVETLNVNVVTGTAGTSSTVSLAAGGANALTAINLSGAADVTLVGTNTARAVTVNSANTGINTVNGNFFLGSVINLNGGARDSVVLGTSFATYNAGGGNDAFSGTVAQINTGADYNVMNGGAGIDTLTVSNGAASTVTMSDNNFRNMTNIERITVTSTTTSNISVTTGGFFNTNFLAEGILLTATTTTGTLTVDMTTFTGNATISATTVGTGAGEGTTNIQTGSGNDTITSVADARGNVSVLSGFAGNDTITGGVNDDSITGGLGADIMTGGGTTANTYNWAFGDSTSTAFDRINDFTAVAANVINAGAAAIVTNATATAGVAAISAAGVATFVAADTTLAQRLIATEAGINAGGAAAAGQAAMFQMGADAFVFISDGVDGLTSADLVIQLIGLDTTSASFDTLTDGGTTFTIA